MSTGKGEHGELGTQVSSIVAMLPSFATKADLYAMEARIFKWILIATIIITTGFALMIAKLVH